MSARRTARIAKLNDQLRARIGLPQFGEGVPGTFLMTAGIMALSPEVIITMWFDIAKYADFSADNDPYSEHDFGSIEIEDVGKIFWKIDYYGDRNGETPAGDPADTEKSYRVMTVMLAEEY